MGSKKVKRKLKASKRDKFTKKKNFSVKILNSGFDNIRCQSLNTFSEIRENYFKYLQNVIKENLESANNENLPNNSLEKISLEVEQPALLACMQSEIYQQIMIKIIHDIKNSTQQMKLHLGIKKILLSKSFEDNEVSPRLKRESINHKSNKFEEAKNEEVYSHIPTLSSIRANYNELNEGWSGQNVFGDEYGSFVDVDDLSCQTDTLPNKNDHGPLSLSCEAQDVMQAVYSPSTGEQYISLYNSHSPKYLPHMMPIAHNGHINNTARQSNYTYISRNLVPIQTVINSEEKYRKSLSKTDSHETEISDDIQVNLSTELNSEEPAPTLKSPNHINEPLEAPLIKDPDLKRKSEREIPKLAKVLEDISEDGTDMSSSSSDNDYDETCSSDTKHENLLADRLEEMRRLFGIEDNEEKNRSKLKNDCEISETGKRNRSHKISKYNTWYHEKTVNLYRLSRMVSELTPESRKVKRDRLFEYFGEDSDEENENGYIQEEKFLLSCKERISHWVVKYLMPFYQKGRIIGRNVFKILGHHVSNTVIQKTLYPDERTVKYVVSKYFAGDKSFFKESDVLCFQPGI